MYTKQEIRIFDAFIDVVQQSQSPRELTMPKIAQAMGISRQALSKYAFNDVSDIITHLRLYVDSQIQPTFQQLLLNNSSDFLISFADNILPILYQNHRYLHALYGPVADPAWRGFIENEYSELILPLVNKKSRQLGLPSKFLATVIIQQILTILSLWMLMDTPDAPDVFKEKFIYLVYHSSAQILH